MTEASCDSPVAQTFYPEPRERQSVGFNFVRARFCRARLQPCRKVCKLNTALAAGLSQAAKAFSNRGTLRHGDHPLRGRRPARRAAALRAVSTCRRLAVRSRRSHAPAPRHRARPGRPLSAAPRTARDHPARRSPAGSVRRARRAGRVRAGAYRWPLRRVNDRSTRRRTAPARSSNPSLGLRSRAGRGAVGGGAETVSAGADQLHDVVHDARDVEVLRRVYRRHARLLQSGHVLIG